MGSASYMHLTMGRGVHWSARLQLQLQQVLGFISVASIVINFKEGFMPAISQR
jgi:hypothetical protein